VLVARQDSVLGDVVSVSPGAAFLVALALTFVIAHLIGSPALRLKGHYLAMATLGFGLIINKIVLGTTLFGAADGINGVPEWNLGLGLTVSGKRALRVENYYIACGLALLTLVVLRNLVRSRVGRALLAIHDRETAANAMGIPTALNLGAVYGCAGEGRIASATRADYAAADAAVLTMECQAGRVYELAGDTSYTLAEFAAEIAKQAGRAIHYVNLPQADYKQALLGAGLAEPLAALLADSDAGVSKGALFDDGKQLSTLIGRATTPLAEVVKAAL
jgi:hypothetical protein